MENTIYTDFLHFDQIMQVFEVGHILGEPNSFVVSIVTHSVSTPSNYH